MNDDMASRPQSVVEIRPLSGMSTCAVCFFFGKASAARMLPARNAQRVITHTYQLMAALRTLNLVCRFL